MWHKTFKFFNILPILIFKNFIYFKFSYFKIVVTLKPDVIIRCKRSPHWLNIEIAVTNKPIDQTNRNDLVLFTLGTLIIIATRFKWNVAFFSFLYLTAICLDIFMDEKLFDYVIYSQLCYNYLTPMVRYTGRFL